MKTHSPYSLTTLCAYARNIETMLLGGTHDTARKG
jgi:hypothetical protein